MDRTFVQRITFCRHSHDRQLQKPNECIFALEKIENKKVTILNDQNCLKSAYIVDSKHTYVFVNETNTSIQQGVINSLR